MTQKTSLLANYRHFVPEVPLDPKFPDGYSFVLIESMEQLASIVPKDVKYFAFDTETSGLNAAKDFLVGYSLSFDGKTAYYIPVNHFSGISLGKPALDFIYNLLMRTSMVFMYFARFDMRMMRYAGYDLTGIKYYDSFIGCNLADTNIRMPSLKKSERHFLGWEAQTFEEALGTSVNFYRVDPVDATFYAATDALGTFNLVRETYKYYQEAKMSGKIDNEVIYPLMEYEEKTWLIDYQSLDRIKEESSERLRYISQEIYRHAGFEFNIASRMELARVLERLGIDTGAYTEKGHMRTGKEFMQNKVDEHPIISLIMEHVVLAKQASSYLDPISRLAQENDSRLRFGYNLGLVPTGRLSSSGEKKNKFFASLNIQAIPKPRSCDYYTRHIDSFITDSPEDYGLTIQDAVMGWYFSTDPSFSDMKIEGMDRHANVRMAFLPNESDYIVSVDYCVDPSTTVTTPEGTKALSALSPGESVLTPEGFKSTYNYRLTGKKKVCRITTKSGKVVTCSPDHKFQVRTIEGLLTWKPLKDILPSDSVIEESLCEKP